jgi:SpoVK/Ycf46/Vps4 family AAA+-type ATPase
VVIETDESVSHDGRRWIERSTHLSWALSSSTRLPLEELPDRNWREVEASTDDPDQAEWSFVLGREVERQHHLTAAQLDMMALAMSVTGGDPAASYRRLTDARLDKLARHTVPRAGWDDLVLSGARKGRLRDLVNRYRVANVVYDEWGFQASPSRGLVGLFSGPSGTGKTMAAEIVAGELGLDLYRLDLSTVVSKYIGETEKNLDELFDAASIGTTVLFFDEADALFGKRSDIHDSKDRYANVETSYLLQRLERYDGIVIMATNYEKNIDQAFLRRVHVRIDFPQPLESERRELWERMLKSNAPQADDIDIDWLAKTFDVTGSSIRNAVLDAAFLAASQQEPIGMAHLVRATARELQKLGRMVTEKQFGTWHAAATATTVR